MKKKKCTVVLIFIVTILLSPDISAQGWEWQNPLPTGNRINCMDFVDSLNGWFGSNAGTILHTTDGGNNWRILFTGIDGLSCRSIDFIDQREGWLIGNTSDNYSFVLHTTDSGNGWNIQWMDSVSNFTLIKFYNTNRGWLGKGRAEIYYTLNGGETWVKSYEGRTYTDEVRAIVFLDTLQGWSEGWGIPLLYSVDGGQSWHEDRTGIVGNNIFFIDPLHGWITTNEKLIRTTDGGKTWLDDLPNVCNVNLIDVFFVDTLTGWVTAWEEGIYRTIDGGWTWDKIYNTMPSMINGAYYFYTPESGWIDFYRTHDGGNTLTNPKKGFTFNHLSDVDFIDENTGWVVGYGGVIGKTTDGGKNWNLQNSTTNIGLSSVFALNEKKIWALGWGIILKTSNGGENWKTQEYQSGSHSAHRAITFIDSLKGWIVGGYFDVGGWILHTNDGGETWVDQTPGYIPRLFDVSFVDANRGWVVAGGGSMLDVGAIYHTDDGGVTWTSQLEDQTRGIKSIFFLDQHTGWAAGDDWILHTEDSGETWIIQSEGNEIYPVDIFFIDDHIGWTCGITGKVFYTYDGGITWNMQYTGSNEFLQAIDFVDEKKGWVVGWSGSILKTVTGGPAVIKDKLTLKNTRQTYYIYPNYPNPFNNQTVISYVVTEIGFVKLSIYNILGKEIATLVNEIKFPGHHRAVWNGTDNRGRDMPSGVYLYRLKFGSGIEERGKMMLIR